MPENALYVEGSVICRLLMGTAGLRRVRANRVLLVIDRHEEVAYSNAAINALNAARALLRSPITTNRRARPRGEADLRVQPRAAPRDGSRTSPGFSTRSTRMPGSTTPWRSPR